VKRFRWRLQRVLDVTVQREKALRAELFGLSRRIVRLRQEVVRRRADLRSVLSDLAGRPVAERMARQEVFLRCAEAVEREIARLDAQARELEQTRSERTRTFLRVRSSRETLERMREDASREHQREQLKLEQRQFDESAHVSHAREALTAGREGS
jgi:flagellar export protein FliJ